MFEKMLASPCLLRPKLTVERPTPDTSPAHQRTGPRPNDRSVRYRGDVTAQPEIAQDGTGFARAMLESDRASAWLGMRLVDNGPGTATVTMTITPDMVNGHDITHGGFVYSLADTAFAVACNGYGRTTVAAGGAITFLVPSGVGDQLVARAVERTRRGRSGVYDVTVSRGDEIIAEFRGNSREIPSPRD
jgi:acyl-CoA thioesterase